MGIFDFLKNAGKKVNKGSEADEIKQTINIALGDQVENLGVSFANGIATLSGRAKSHAAKQKATLLAGNHEGVERVDDNQLIATEEQKEPDVEYYTIQKGDSLSKIAEAKYGDAMKYPLIFEANKEVIEDPNKIYPGQQIRIPVNPDA